MLQLQHSSSKVDRSAALVGMAIMLAEIQEAVPPDGRRCAARFGIQPSADQVPRAQAKPIKSRRVRIESGNEPDESISIPVTAFRLLNSILTEVAKGNAA